MGMFDNMMGGEGQRTPVDILDSLLDPKNIELKTDLNITQIKVLTQIDWYKRLANPDNKDKHPLELLAETLTYYMSLMASLKRKSREESIEGIKQSRDSFMQNDPVIGQVMNRGGSYR